MSVRRNIQKGMSIVNNAMRKQRLLQQASSQLYGYVSTNPNTENGEEFDCVPLFDSIGQCHTNAQMNNMQGNVISMVPVVNDNAAYSTATRNNCFSRNERITSSMVKQFSDRPYCNATNRYV